MNKDLKDLIDSVEKEAISKTELEQKIQSLKEEINKLNFTITEQKIIIDNLKNRLSSQTEGQDDLPSEILILKDIITSQRTELNEKDTYIKNLNERIENEELLDAQKLIVKLYEELDQNKKEIELLRSQLEKSEIERSGIGEINEEDIESEENEELINIKRLNFQLMEENGLLRLEIESLQAQLQEFLEGENSEELIIANEKSDIILSKLKDYKAQIENLKEQLENASEFPILSTENDLKFTEMQNQIDNLKSDLLESEKRNQELNNALNTLKAQKLQVENTKDQTISTIKDIPKKYQSSLFDIMYYLLEDDKKQSIIDLLIQNLNNKNLEAQKIAIKILSKIKESKVYDAFIGALNDKNWLIRYSIIKALSKFEDKRNDLRILLAKFTRDADVDVRDLVLKILNESSDHL